MSKTHLELLTDKARNIVLNVFDGNAPLIFKALDETFKLEQENGKEAKITVPIKLIIEKFENGEYCLRAKIEVKTIKKQVDETEPVMYNPDQPDMFEEEEV